VHRLLALGVAATLAARGSSTATSPPAASRTIELSWREPTAKTGERLIFKVERLVLQPHRWSARVAFRNESRLAFVINRPHRAQGWMFGLVLSRTSRPDPAPSILVAPRIEPELPTIVAGCELERDVDRFSDPPARSLRSRRLRAVHDYSDDADGAATTVYLGHGSRPSTLTSGELRRRSPRTDRAIAIEALQQSYGAPADAVLDTRLRHCERPPGR
jgi:hypothetical protein